MNITINTTLLKNAITGLDTVIDRKTTIPVLSHVQIEANGDKVILRATNLEQAATITLNGNSAEDGKCCIPLAKLKEYIGLLPDGDLKIKTAPNDRVEFSSKKSKIKMASLPFDVFPEIPSSDKEWIKGSSEVLIDAFRGVSFAISKEESRFTLNGALIEVEDGNVHIVATDGHRLAHKVIQFTEITKENKSFLIPLKLINSVCKILDGPREISISVDDNHIYIKADDIQLCGRRMTGNFPDYKRVVPKDLPDYCTIDREDFIGALRRCKVSVKEVSAITERCLIDISGGSMNIKASSSSDLLESDESIDLKDFTANSVNIGLNCNYVLDYLSSANQDIVKLEWKDPMSAVVFRSENNENYCVIMPMRG